MPRQLEKGESVAFSKPYLVGKQALLLSYLQDCHLTAIKW